MTIAEAKEILGRLSREEKEMLLRLPPHEAMLVLELHRSFPSMRLVEE